MFENYKTWRAENSYDEQTPRKKKELDDLWDAKMGLWQKSGVKFDKDNIIGKNEIVWDPGDPEVKKLRGGTFEQQPSTVPSQTGIQLQPTESEQNYMLIEGVVEKLKELNATENRLHRKATRADLLAEYKRLGGSKSAAARKFAEDNGLLE